MARIVKVIMSAEEGANFWKAAQEGDVPVVHAGRWHVVIGRPVRNFFDKGSYEFKLAPWDRKLHGELPLTCLQVVR